MKDLRLTGILFSSIIKLSERQNQKWTSNLPSFSVLCHVPKVCSDAFHYLHWHKNLVYSGPVRNIYKTELKISESTLDCIAPKLLGKKVIMHNNFERDSEKNILWYSGKLDCGNKNVNNPQLIILF